MQVSALPAHASGWWSQVAWPSAPGPRQGRATVRQPEATRSWEVGSFELTGPQQLAAHHLRLLVSAILPGARVFLPLLLT